MAEVVPTVLATNASEYAVMMKRASELSDRVHVDVSDGKFTAKTINPAQIIIPERVRLDVHLMVEQPEDYIETVLSLGPKLVIFHAESKGDLPRVIAHTKELGARTGVALLQQSQPQDYADLIRLVDHVLIFTGQLGHNGGQFDIDQIIKVAEIRAIKHEVEISVDGGVNDQNALLIVTRDVNVLYAGSYFHNAQNPKRAFDTITARIKTQEIS